MSEKTAKARAKPAAEKGAQKRAPKAPAKTAATGAGASSKTPAPTPSKAAKPAARRAAPPAAKAEERPASGKGSGRGGRRPGAGRPPGSGKLGETVSVRVPRKDAARIKAARDALAVGQPWPGGPSALALFDHGVRAGFPAPSDDAGARRVDLYTLFSPKPESTFLVKVSGSSMREAGILDGDYLVVDRSIEPRHGHVVVAYLEGQGLLAKRLRVDAKGAFLDSDNPDFGPIPLGEGSQAKIWGVARAKAGLLL